MFLILSSPSHTLSVIPSPSSRAQPRDLHNRNEKMGNIPEQNRWYPLRVTYGREMKLKDRLDKLHLTSYIPMRYKNMVKDGKTRRVLAPAVSNLCFVYASRKDIEELRTRMMETLQFHFIWNRATSLPIVVPDKAMDDFIKVSSAVDDDIIYLSEVSPLLRSGQRVKVKTGPFAGVEGRIIRIKKSKRVMVELPDMLAVATTYIRPECLEVLDEE